jgi:hypothetical protein
MERIRRHVSYANVAATLALVLAMSGGAVAATGGFSSGGTLRACANEEGAIRLLKPGKRCGKGQKTVSWNQTGPAGAKGATGAAGASGGPGATGAAGAAGAKGADGASAVSLWAEVRENGEVISGNGIVSVEKGTGPIYILTFNRDISKCAVVASPATGGAEHFVGDTAPLSGAKADVIMENTSMVAVAADFGIAVFC